MFHKQRNARTHHFHRSYLLKANKVSKGEGTRKGEHPHRFQKCADWDCNARFIFSILGSGIEKSVIQGFRWDYRLAKCINVH